MCAFLGVDKVKFPLSTLGVHLEEMSQLEFTLFGVENLSRFYPSD